MPAAHGTATWCDGDLRPNMPQVSGRLALMQALRNRLETAPGTLAWMGKVGIDYGYDLRTLVNTKVRDLTGITGRIVAEVQKDERVESAQCRAQWLGDDRIQIDITVTDGEGAFPMTLMVSSLTVDLLREGP